MATTTLVTPTPKSIAMTFPHLDVHTLRINEAHKPRQWVVLTLPFKEAMLWFAPKEYDFEKNQGEQRPETKGWITTLANRIQADEFAPAVWSACLRASHRQKAEFHADGTVTLHVNSNNPFALIDGNHRRLAFLKIQLQAEKKGDQKIMDMIDETAITIQIYLEPARSRKNFEALQEGRKVSTDLLEMMRFGDKSTPQRDIARKTILALRRNKDSHLCGKIGTGENVSNMLGIKTAISTGASELSCSIQGGANIAYAFGKDATWLEACYVEGWEAVRNHTVQEEFMGSPIASVLMPKKLLCPLGEIGGKKGGTTLIIGICNMWAYMKAFRNLDAMGSVEREYLATIVDDIFDVPSKTGLNAPLKRSLMGQFAAAYFEPIVTDEEEPEPGKVIGSGGIPRPLKHEMMSPSSFGRKDDNGDILNGSLLDELTEDKEEGEQEEAPIKGKKAAKTYEA